MPFRTGLICTECVPNHTLALFSARCSPDAECKDHWIWAVTIAAGFVYACFLLFQGDVTSFIDKQTQFSKKRKVVKQRLGQTYPQGGGKQIGKNISGPKTGRRYDENGSYHCRDRDVH